MANFYLRRGDTLPALLATVRNVSGTVVDLTSVTGVVMRMIPQTGGDSIAKTMSIVAPATNGQVTYQWVTGDWSGPDALTDGTIYNLEFELTYSGGNILTIPTRGFKTLEITHDIQ